MFCWLRLNFYLIASSLSKVENDPALLEFWGKKRVGGDGGGGKGGWEGGVGAFYRLENEAAVLVCVDIIFSATILTPPRLPGNQVSHHTGHFKPAVPGSSTAPPTAYG
jgi:hypothetical protein